MSEDELRISRRLFLRHSAAATAMAATAAGISLKTDALALAQERALTDFKEWPQDILPYAYHEESLP